MRKDFTVTLKSRATFKSGATTLNYNVRDGEFCSESTPTYTQRRKPKGWLPPEPYEFHRLKYRRTQGRLNITQSYLGSPVSDQTWDGCVGGVIFDSVGNFDECYVLDGSSLAGHRDRALVRARLAMKDSKVNLGVAFAERTRTADLVTSTALQLVNSVRQLRRGNFRGAARELGIDKPRKPRGSSVTNRWLELQYGWKPLLNDVYGSAHALATRDTNDWIVTGKGASREKINNEVRRDLAELSWNFGRCTARGEYGSYVRIDAIPQNDLLQSFTSLGITNPALIGWELVPFSFVVDWFLPIGSFLDSLDAMLGFGPSWTSISSIQRCRWVDEMLNSSVEHDDGWLTIGTRQGTAFQEQIILLREAYDSVPLPTLPRFKDPVSLGHMANALSLLASVFSGRRG